jgi:hypothetical protein
MSLRIARATTQFAAQNSDASVSNKNGDGFFKPESLSLHRKGAKTQREPKGKPTDKFDGVQSYMTA